MLLRPDRARCVKIFWLLLLRLVIYYCMHVQSAIDDAMIITYYDP